MIRTVVGQAEGLNTGKVVAKVLRQCRQGLDGRLPQAGLLFTGAHFDHRWMLDDINRAFPGLELIGCTTAGEFSSAFGFSDDSISLMVIATDDLEFRAGVGEGLSEDPEGAVRAALSMARMGLSRPEALCLTLPEGGDGRFNRIVRALNEELGRGCPVFGGCAATQVDDEGPPLQFCGDRILTDAIPVLLWAGPLAYTFTVANSWKPVGKPAEVTAAEGRVVSKIDGAPALDFYHHYLGLHTQPALDFPLAVFEPGRDYFYLREPIHYNTEDGQVTFSEKVPLGARVQLTEARREDLLADSRGVVRNITVDAASFCPSLALSFSCALRKGALGTAVAEEVNLLRDLLPPGLPFMGFFGFGEIAPLVRGEASFFHNATMVIILLGLISESGNGLDVCDDMALPPEDPEWPDYDEALFEKLRLENAFLKKKLQRSENYRKRLEQNQEQNSIMHHQIIEEVKETRREIQRQQAALRKSEEKYRRIVETAGEGFVLTDENLIIVDVNEACCRLLGYPREYILGKRPYEMASQEFRDYIEAHVDEILSQDYRYFESEFVRSDGRAVPVLVHANTLNDDHGRIIGNMAFITDMTEHKKALLLAAEIQKSLMPQAPPEAPGFDVAGYSLPCDEIGGDYFDYLWEEGRVGGPLRVVVGDIAGHGVDAALLMTTARAFLRMRAARSGTSAEIVTDLNQHLAHDVFESGRFMTLFYLALYPEEDSLEWVRAGHDPALLYDPLEDRFEELRGPGLALGVDEHWRYQAVRRQGLRRGQIITVGTDGIWEAANQSGERFGKERIREIIRKEAQSGAQEILQAVFDEVTAFSRGLITKDDMTMVIVKSEPEGK